MGEIMKIRDIFKRDLREGSVAFLIYKYLLLLPSMYLRMAIGFMANLSFVPGIVYPQSVKSDDGTIDVEIQVGIFYTEINVNGTVLVIQRFAGKIERVDVIVKSSVL